MVKLEEHKAKIAEVKAELNTLDKRSFRYRDKMRQYNKLAKQYKQALMYLERTV